MESLSHPLRAGAARIDITPSTPQHLDGYGNRTTRSEGSYMPIYARALSLAAEVEALIVAAEVLGFDTPQVERVRAAIGRETGLPPHAVVLLATHTHCAPRVRDMVMPGEVDPEYVAWFEAQMVEAAVAAREAARPAVASLSRATGSLGINRRVRTETGTIMRPNLEGVNDPSVTTVWFDTPAGELVATLTVYACHSTCRGGPLIGGDYPGVLSETLEREVGGVALFGLGCAGDLRPHFTSDAGGFRPARVDEVQAAGRELAGRVQAERGARRPINVASVRTAAEAVDLPFGELPDAAALARTRDEDENPLRRQWAERMLAALEQQGLPGSVPCEVQVVALAPALAWVCMAGEMVVDFACALSRAAGPAIIPTGYANASVGYVPSRRIHPEGGYEVDGSHHYYVQPAPFAEDAEDRILAAAGRLLQATGVHR